MSISMFRKDLENIINLERYANTNPCFKCSDKDDCNYRRYNELETCPDYKLWSVEYKHLESKCNTHINPLSENFYDIIEYVNMLLKLEKIENNIQSLCNTKSALEQEIEIARKQFIFIDEGEN